ncbi:hypothetical protein MesoLjLb_66230 [Mesorhizobium sp. L-8-3]|nr:hypothetical protein MesoLjLb_66230 [Mesorhizobium sp. L-8-3]
MAISSGPVRDPDTGHAISPVVAAALYIKPRGLLTPRQARKVDALKQGSDAFAEMRRLGNALQRYPSEQEVGNTGPLDRRCNRLRHHSDNNAIELPWSNGQGEGQINRLKTLKRAMYGSPRDWMNLPGSRVHPPP